jgi:hypothetical protein
MNAGGGEEHLSLAISIYSLYDKNKSFQLLNVFLDVEFF